MSRGLACGSTRQHTNHRAALNTPTHGGRTFGFKSASQISHVDSADVTSSPGKSFNTVFESPKIPWQSFSMCLYFKGRPSIDPVSSFINTSVNVNKKKKKKTEAGQISDNFWTLISRLDNELMHTNITVRTWRKLCFVRPFKMMKTFSDKIKFTNFTKLKLCEKQHTHLYK